MWYWPLTLHFSILLQNKQKRNSCIAVMSDLNTSQFQINTPVSAPSNSSVQATAVSVSCSDKLNVPVTSIREAANSLQNIAGNQSANSPVERSAKNKNFRKMSQLIFNNYNSASKNKVILQILIYMNWRIYIIKENQFAWMSLFTITTRPFGDRSYHAQVKN